MESITVAHRWANKDFGRYGTLTASNSCHSRGRNYFSYSTVFGQWVDMGKNVVLVYNGGTTPTSSRYRLWKSDFPKDVHVFPYDDGGGYGYYNGCELVSGGYHCDFKDSDFLQQHRITLLDYYAQCLYNQFANITTSTKKGAENVDFEMWGYFEELCSLYNDISVSKYLKSLKKIKYTKQAFKSEKDRCREYNKAIDAKKKMVTLIASGERDVETITDAMFGEGSYKKYTDTISAKFGKADATKAKMFALCHRLGMNSPYGSEWGYTGSLAKNEYSAPEIRKWDAKKRIEVHFANLIQIENDKHRDEIREKRAKSKRNLFKYITGYETTDDFRWNLYAKADIVRNMFNGEVYDLKHQYIFRQWFEQAVYVHLDDYINSEDKHAWLEMFYAKAKEIAENIKAAEILINLKVAFVERSLETRYFINCNQVLDLNDEDRALVERFYEMQEKYFHDKEARQRAADMERERRKQEEERERAYMAQVKQEQIDECLERGVEGRRDLWRLHLMDVWQAEREGNYKDDFFMGGNILLRFNLDKTHVETSKGIRIPIAICKKFYPIFKGWHENPSTFKPMQIDTKGSGRYTISEYKDDILTAGCHDIAWQEMERMWNEIEKLSA